MHGSGAAVMSGRQVKLVRIPLCAPPAPGVRPVCPSRDRGLFIRDLDAVLDTDSNTFWLNKRNVLVGHQSGA